MAEGVVSNDHSYSDQQAAKPNPKTRLIPMENYALKTVSQKKQILRTCYQDLKAVVESHGDLKAFGKSLKRFRKNRRNRRMNPFRFAEKLTTCP